MVEHLKLTRNVMLPYNAIVSLDLLYDIQTRGDAAWAIATGWFQGERLTGAKIKNIRKVLKDNGVLDAVEAIANQIKEGER